MRLLDRPATAAPPALQSLALRDAQRLAHGVHAAEKRDCDGKAGNEEKNARVGTQIEDQREAEIGHQDVECAGERGACAPTRESSGEREQPCLDEDLRCDAYQLCAKSGTYSDFATAPRCVLSQQRSDVDADKDHQQHRGAKKHRKLLANTTKDAALEVRGVAQVQIPASVAAIVLLSDEGASQGVEFCSGGGVLNAGTLADDRLQSVVGQRVRRSVSGEIAQRRERNPGGFRNAAEDAGESGGGYTDDGESVAIDGDRAADDGGVGVETLAPESVGKDDLVLRAIGTIIGAGIECADRFAAARRAPQSSWRRRCLRRSRPAAYRLDSN